MKSKKHTRLAVVLSVALILAVGGTAIALGAGRSTNGLIEFETIYSDVTEHSRLVQFQYNGVVYSPYVVDEMLQSAGGTRGMKVIGFASGENNDRYRIFERDGYSIGEYIVVQDNGFMNPATIYVGNSSSSFQELSLDDVRALAAKGDTLQYSDLPNLRPSMLSSYMGGYNPTLYGVEGGYRLLITFNDTLNPENGISSISLERIWDNGGSGIDIRYEDVDEFIRAHPLYPADATPNTPLSLDILNQIYLGMTSTEVYNLFGEPDYQASGLMWFGYHGIGEFDPSFGFNGEISRINAGGKQWDVSQLIRSAVIGHFENGGSDGESYRAAWYELTSFNANSNEFTVEGITQYELYLPNGEYDVQRIDWNYASFVFTFAKNADYDYALKSSVINEGWLYGRLPELKCYVDAMYHFIGAVPYDGRFGLHHGGTVAVTRHAGSEAESDGSWVLLYFPGATLQIEPYDELYATYNPGSFIIEYTDSRKNITVGRNGTGEIMITDDLIGIYDVDNGEYAMRFEKYIVEHGGSR